MVHDHRPLADVPLQGATVINDRYIAAQNQNIHNCNALRLTGNLAGSVLALEVEETRILGEPSIGISLSFKPATGNLAAGNVQYLYRMIMVVTHGPVKAMNGGTGVILPGEEVTPAAPATDTAMVTYNGLITRRTNPLTQSKLGVAMDRFEAFDHVGDIATMWVDPSYIS